MRFVSNKPSLSLRIGLLFSITFTVGLCLAFSFAYYVLSKSLEKSSHEVISSKSHAMVSILKTQGVPGLRAIILSEKSSLINASFMIRVLDMNGNQILIKESVQEKKFDFKNDLNNAFKPTNDTSWQALSAINDEDKFDIFTEKVDSRYFLQVGKSSEDREALLGKILNVFGATGVLFIFLSGGLGIWYSRKSLKPLRELLSAIQVIEKGDLSQRVPLGKSNDELKNLGETFNRMIARIEKLVSVMKESLDNVAHEIRTPLTRIRIVAEEALVCNHPELIKTALEDSAESVEAISGLVDQVMSISEAEAGVLTMQLENCKLKDLIEDVVEIYEFVAQDKNIVVVILPIDQTLAWNLDRKRVKQAIGNLLDNAIKFSPSGGTIQLFADFKEDVLNISISDEGIGINGEDIPKIWDRLYRGDRSRSTKGLGLGLSIVKSIAIAHGGKASAIPKSKGTLFSISIPK